jgi:hypothetical protein
MDSTPKEKWFVKYWRPCAAWTYLAICVFDFVAMPVYTAKTNLTLEQVITVTRDLRQEDRLQAITSLLRKNAWEPITLSESGMFHIAFGAILGVAAWTRGRVQEANVRNGYAPVEEPTQPAPRPPVRSKES